MSFWEAFFTILGMALVTIVTRGFFLFPKHELPMPAWLKQGLRYAPLAALEVTEGQDKLTCYAFNTGVAKHWFCSICGTYTFHQRRSAPTTYGVNVACLGLDPYRDFPDVPVLDGVRHALDHGGKARLVGRLKFEADES